MHDSRDHRLGRCRVLTNIMYVTLYVSDQDQALDFYTRTEFDGLSARGVTFEEPEPTDYAFGVRITALDPDGNRISLRQPRQRGTK
jgi:catechol 2,3-dioxygenase-like lactoylglutathione lyase family enzyme